MTQKISNLLFFVPFSSAFPLQGKFSLEALAPRREGQHSSSILLPALPSPPLPSAAGEGFQGWRRDQDSHFSVALERGGGRMHFLSRNLWKGRGQRCCEILLGASLWTMCIWICCTNMPGAAGTKELLLPSCSQGGEMRLLGGGEGKTGHIAICASSSRTITKGLFSVLSFRLMPVTTLVPPDPD